MYGGYIRHQRNYHQLNSTDTPGKLYQTQLQNSQEKKLSFELYYRTTCKDCQEMAKQGLVQKVKHAQNKYNVVAVDTVAFKKANPQAADKWYKNNNITHTPTLIVRAYGHPIYLYSGTNIKTFDKLLHGKNPKTNQNLKLTKHPSEEIYQNEFTKTTENYPSKALTR